MGIAKFIENNLKAIGLSLAGILLVCVATAGFFELKRGHEAKAQNFLWEVKTKADQLVRDKKSSEAMGVLQEVIEKFQGSRAAYEALLTIGDIAVQEKLYDKATQAFKSAAEAAPDKFSKLLAVYNRAAAEEQAAKFQDAANSFAEAKKMAVGDFLDPELLMGQARCLEKLGNKAAAIALYKEIKDKYSNKAFYGNAAAVFQARLEAPEASNKN